jgi:hypothetical protein
MLSPSNQCTCDGATMAALETLAVDMLRGSLVPAAVCSVIVLALVLGLLAAGSAQLGAAFSARRHSRAAAAAAAAGAVGGGSPWPSEFDEGAVVEVESRAGNGFKAPRGDVQRRDTFGESDV